jgi:hypothetical protein
VVTPLLIVGFSLITLWRDVSAENWGNAVFAGFNAFVAVWAILAYIGFGNTLVDIWHGLTNWLYVDATPKAKGQSPAQAPNLDWQAVLYHGDAKGTVPLAARAYAITHTGKDK